MLTYSQQHSPSPFLIFPSVIVWARVLSESLRLTRSTADFVKPKTDFPKRDQVTAEPVPDFPKRDMTVAHPVPDFPKRDGTVAQPVPDFPKRDESVAHPVPDFPKRDGTATEATDFPKRDSMFHWPISIVRADVLESRCCEARPTVLEARWYDPTPSSLVVISADVLHS